MYVTVRRPGVRQEERRLVWAGAVQILVVVSLILLSTAIYNKSFVSFTHVEVRADRAGLLLAKNSDVRYHGVIVGQIRAIEQDGQHAVLRLGLDPDLAANIPGNVSVSIVPTTLFGAKFVSLDDPPDATATGSLTDGMTIPADRVTTSVELSKVLANLFPLLRAVRPSDLNFTLSALAHALDGRGEALGSTLERLDDYLATLNPHLPTLRRDLDLLASVASIYDQAAPQLLSAMRDLSVTADTVSTKKADLSRLLDKVIAVSSSGAQLVGDSGDAAIRLLDQVEPVLALLEKYAPQHYCLFEGLYLVREVLRKVYKEGAAKQFVKFPTPQTRAYDQRDLPRYDDKRGPRCYGLPYNPPAAMPFSDLANGTELDTEAGRGPVTLLPPLGPLPTQLRTDAASAAGVPLEQVTDIEALLLAGVSAGGGRP